jgi:2'-5' RNA ligase
VIRAFVAIRIDPAVAQKIGELQAKLDSPLQGIRWVKPENLHLTLKFLGPVSEDKIASIADSLRRALRDVPRFSVLCSGLGVFPDIKRAKVLWVGLEGNSIARLAETIEGALEPLGFAREKREFKPHLTIGRWREAARRADALRQETDRGRNVELGASPMNEVILYQSALQPAGAVYTALKVFPLGQK